MKLWLGEYLDEVGVVEHEFLTAYSELPGRDSKHISKYLQTDKTIDDTEILLGLVKTKPHAQTFQHIAQALNEDSIRPDVNSEEVQRIQTFHLQWQERMRAWLLPRAGYQKQIRERIYRLKQSGFSLKLLNGMLDEDDPVTTYANKLSELLVSPQANASDLIKEIEQLLNQAEQKHLGLIAELASLMANHFVPHELWTSHVGKGVKIGSDEPAPAIYRHIQNWRNDAVSQICAYDKMKMGVAGAIPICREALDDSHLVSSVAYRLDNTIDHHQLLMTGSDSYRVENAEFSPRKLRVLNKELDKQSKATDSRFVYGITPDSIDEDLASALDESLPALHHYSHVIEECNDIPEVDDLQSFLNSAGAMIEKRSQSFTPTAPDAELHDLLVKILSDMNLSDKLQAAPQPVDRVKYLKWFNELVKSEKGVREALKEYPEIVGRAAEYYSSVTEFSATSINVLKSFFSQFL